MLPAVAISMDENPSPYSDFPHCRGDSLLLGFKDHLLAILTFYPLTHG